MTIKLNTSQLYLLGDIHAKFDILEKYIELLPNDVAIIQVGDYGIGFKSFAEDYEQQFHINEKLANKNIKMFVIRGNHDDPSKFVEDSDMNFSYITFLPDYTTLEVNDKRILCVGGAISVDRADRIDKISYWIDEIFRLPDDMAAISTDYDILVTHASAKGMPPFTTGNIRSYIVDDPKLEADLLQERNQILQLLRHLKQGPLTHMYFGHYHQYLAGRCEGVFYRGLMIGEMVSIL